MIPSAFITEWRKNAPWLESSQVEQDLILSKALVQIYSDPHLKQAFAFRGGTSLQKIFFPSPTRYSEDIDLVQVRKEAIGPSIDALRKVLDPWLGNPKREFNQGRVVLKYAFQSEDAPVKKMRLKIEINNGEHLTVLGHKTAQFKMQSPWFSGGAEVLTFELEEIFGTKLRALYQRKKGRDLYDVSMAYQHFADLDDQKMVHCFLQYMKHEGNSVSRAEYEANLSEKLDDNAFLEDINPLLKAGLPKFDAKAAGEIFKNRTLILLPGEPWKGPQPKAIKKKS
jgi:predicted nucleotidyltransferase component of viral defense system